MVEKNLAAAKPLSAREALLEAAQHLFSEKSYEAVSTRELAEAAGVNLGAIQYHFGSKAKLFVETVHRMMHGNGCARTQFSELPTPSTKEQAAENLCRFIFSFLTYLLRPEGPQACRLMIREIFTETSRDEEMYEALVSSVVNEFSRPLEEMLIATLKLFKPDASEKELQRYVQSILGQCLVYTTHRPFVERLMNGSIGESPRLEQTADHISRFSLQALGCNQAFIDKTIASVTEKL
jgi:AcrR family transcriptional regulator